MILDKLNEFCDATSVAAAAGNAVVGNVIDLGSQPADLGNGAPIWLVIQTDTEIITGGTAGTIQFTLESDSTDNLATSATVHITTPTYVTDDAAANSAQLNAGGIIYCGPLPTGVYERYLGIRSTVGTTEVTAGKINAFLTTDPAKYQAYSDFT